MSSAAAADEGMKDGGDGRGARHHTMANKSEGGREGWLFAYLISRKKSSNNSNTVSPSSADNAVVKASQQTQHHRLADAAVGSRYFGSLALPFDNSESDENFKDTKLASGAASSPPSSWMSKAWRTVDSAADWMSPPSSEKKSLPLAPSDNSADKNSTQSSSWWSTVLPAITSTTLSDAISSISIANPFNKDGNVDDSVADKNSIHNSTHLPTKSSSVHLLPKISRFEWATKRHNPYQAGIGRYDADYYYYFYSPLSLSNPSYFWGGAFGAVTLLGLVSSWFPSSSWWNGYHSHNSNKLEDNYNVNDGRQKVLIGHHNDGERRKVMRSKSLPSEASVMAVKNLLALIQQQQYVEEQVLLLQQQQQVVEGRLLQQQEDDQHQQVPTSQQQQQQQQKQQQQQPRQRLLSQQPPPHHSPLSLPVHHSSPKFDPFTATNPRSPSLLPFPALNLDHDSSSSDFESDASPSSRHYPSPRMTPVHSSFQASPKLQSISGRSGSGAVPQLPLFPLKSSPVVRRSSSSLQDGSFTTAIPTKANNIIINSNRPSNNNHDKNNDNTNIISCSNNSNHQAASEMAARLTEGTLRAYRDLALDEATELHLALHHWTYRWERPFWGWLEAGPVVWFSEKGYSPYSAGKKVSQIQAVLARRCAVIGEIQQHLWRANWQRGVAEWGMLGGDWAAVMLEHGDMTTDAAAASAAAAGGGGGQTTPSPQKKPKRLTMKIFNHSSFVGGNVSNSRGGQILVDEGALTTWSIDGVKVVRDQLYRAGLTGAKLPFYENWPNEIRHFNGDSSGGNDEIDHPAWATKELVKAVVDGNNVTSSSNETSHLPTSSSPVVITNLPGMADEVSALLQSIEVNLDQQRQRRLNKLRPPSSLRRNWYLIVLGIPAAAYATYHVCKEHGGYYLLKEVLAKIGVFYKEHVSEPIWSIYRELFTGRIDVSDRKARIDAIESLKRMIRSWLDETFSDMPESEKIERANNMDISLVEELKEESIKHIYELNSVVRCSLIEMQFIKKELLNALVAMDELMGSNEINMRIAAMTPAIILLIAIRKVFRVIFYAVFKFGSSKEEIHASFRKIILDIERLLLMRDDPPPPPEPLSWSSAGRTTLTGAAPDDILNNVTSRQTLSAADLGMLLLHIHECRNILWVSRRRFQNDVLRNVSEDLAELAGERGPVSVRQQLQILCRMNRTYKFMKVENSSMISGVVM